MIVEITPNKIIKGATTIWNQSSLEVDMTMDVKNLTFRPGSVGGLFAFHVLDHLFENEIADAVSNWRKCLKPGAELYVIVDDLDYLCRSYITGDFAIQKFNQEFSHPMYFNKESLIEYLARAGFREDLMKIWYLDVPNLFSKQEHELVLSAKKHE